MVTGFVRGCHLTPCDIYVIIQRLDRNGLNSLQTKSEINWKFIF